MKLDIPRLTGEQIERLCLIAEETAREYVYSKILKNIIEKLDICAEVEGTKPVNLTVDVTIILVKSAEGVDVRKIADGAVEEAFERTEGYLRGLVCRSQK